MESPDLIKVGKIVGTHGYKGTVKVEPLTDFPERFRKGQKIKISQGLTAADLVLESIGVHQGMLLMRFQGIETKEEAAKYRNSFLNISPDELYKLPEGTYYQFQLIGMRVEDLEQGYLGELIEILETGANDVYVVKSEVHGEILIPAIKSVISRVDVAQGLMQVKLLPGLLGEEI